MTARVGAAPASLGLVLAVLLGGCSEPHVDAAIRVNGEPITVARVRYALTAARATQPAVPATQVIDELLDQELLAQRALKLELDKRPGVIAAMEAARARLLAQAYLEAIGTGKDAREARAFYSEHRALFEERRLFRLFELAVVAPPETLDELRAAAQRLGSLPAVAGWLTGRRMAFNIGATTKPSEHLAPGFLARLSAMKPGEIIFMPTAGGASLIQLVQSHHAPLSEEEALPLVERHLARRQQKELLEIDRKRLREAATIEYVIDMGADEG